MIPPPPTPIPPLGVGSDSEGPECDSVIPRENVAERSADRESESSIDLESVPRVADGFVSVGEGSEFETEIDSECETDAV